MIKLENSKLKFELLKKPGLSINIILILIKRVFRKIFHDFSVVFFFFFVLSLFSR